LAPAAVLPPVSGILLLLLRWTALMLGGFLQTGRCSGSVHTDSLFLPGLRRVALFYLKC